ncbi:hypothetical protein [Leptospira interrogans]|uniref:hypothetical protein n=1 Tax=Leptospira interrogans TaxID=173 RepID=UPI0009E34B2D|nr:hypothetical protein [Leptospira interrogans]
MQCENDYYARSVESVEFEKFRRNCSEKNSMKRFLRKHLKLSKTLSPMFLVSSPPVIFFT